MCGRVFRQVGFSMSRSIRQICGIDRQFGLFLVVAPIASLFAFVVAFWIEAWLRLDFQLSLYALRMVVIGGTLALVFHYLIATIPSIVVWGAVMRLTDLAGLSRQMGMRMAAVLTSFIASLLILVWARDPYYVNLVPRLTVVAVITSYLVIEVLLFYEKAAVRA